MNVVELAGGVGGAKLAEGLAAHLGTDLTVVVNTGDDLELYGLEVWPDHDTVMYTLAGLDDEERGWGLRDETWTVMDGLAALVREGLGADPYSGVIYVFRARRADRVKPLLWDGTGLVLVAKRLEESSFRWPRISDGVMRLTSSQLSALLEGLDWTRVHAVRVRAPQATL